MNNTINLTKKLIELKASSIENANMAVREVEKILNDSGINVEILENEGHLMLVSSIGKGNKTLILNGHLDVVPANEDQYSPIIKDGNLHGRGSYDMLGSCAAMVTAMCDLVNEDLGINVLLTLSTTEETNGALCTKYILDQGHTGIFAICGEPTNLKISVMSKGVLRVKISVFGKSAHASRPWLGENAIVKAVELFHQIEQLPFAKRTNKYFDGASINLSILNGGKVINQVPDKAEMILDIRYVPGDNPENIIKEIRSIGDYFQAEVAGTLDAVLVEEDDKYLTRLKTITENLTGLSDILIAQHGTADTVFFQEKGIPSIEFGPTGAGHHGPEEYLNIESLETYKKIIIDFIYALSYDELNN